MANVTITRQYNPDSQNIDFFTKVTNGIGPFLAKERVNLSRGHTRMYSLDNLSAHNGSGARWKDGNTSIHTPAFLAAYLERCDRDIQAAVARAEAAFNAEVAALFNTSPTTVVSLSY